MPRLLRASYGTFNSSEAIGPACWPHHDLFFVHRGIVELDFSELARHVTIKAGQGVLIWPQTRFAGRPVAGTVQASIQHFEVHKGDGIFSFYAGGRKNGFSLQGSAPSKDLTKDVERAIVLGRHERMAEIPVRLALLALILTEGAYSNVEGTRRDESRIDLKRLEIWLRDRVAHNPGVPELAAAVGLSPSRFRAVFLEEHHRTAGEFIRAFREVEARRLLVETRLSLKEIAAALGYADAVGFHRAFQGRAGLTPGLFRRKNRVSG